MTLRAKLYENKKKNRASYISGLRYNIQDELTLVTIESIHKCYQLALKIEEKQERKGEQSSIGRGNSFRGRGRFQEEETTQETKGKLAAVKGLRMKVVVEVPLEEGDLIKEADLVEGEYMFSQEGVTTTIKWITNILGVQRSKDQ